MTPIVSPWVFYAMTVVDSLTILSVIVMILSVIVVGLSGVIKLIDMSYYPDEDLQKVCSNLIHKTLPVLVVSAILVTFVPNSTTITKMLVAQNVTYERVEVATDTVEKVYEDIMELFEGDGDSE